MLFDENYFAYDEYFEDNYEYFKQAVFTNDSVLNAKTLYEEFYGKRLIR